MLLRVVLGTIEQTFSQNEEDFDVLTNISFCFACELQIFHRNYKTNKQKSAMGSLFIYTATINPTQSNSKREPIYCMLYIQMSTILHIRETN